MDTKAILAVLGKALYKLDVIQNSAPPPTTFLGVNEVWRDLTKLYEVLAGEQE